MPAPEEHPGRALTAAFRRTVPTVDLLGARDHVDAAALGAELRLSATHFYQGLVGLRSHLDLVIDALPDLLLAPNLVGTIAQPDGSPGRRLHVEVRLPDARRGPDPQGLTGPDGGFTLRLPRGTGLSAGDHLTLTVRGANGEESLTVPARRAGTTGLVGEFTLPRHLVALPESVIAGLIDALPDLDSSAQPAAEPVVNRPVLRLGEDTDGVCGQVFGQGASEQRFPYSVFFRLVEPRTSVMAKAMRFTFRDGKSYGTVPAFTELADGFASRYVQRVAIGQPISVDGFRDGLTGIGPDGRVLPNELVPMAGTLGLGYVVRMAQRWTPVGLTLGDLTYSLPLAPGEQQRLAIFERRDTSAVRDVETLDIVEAQSFQQEQDTSAEATFAQAFRERANGGSRYETAAESESWGTNFLIASGGGGSSHASGSTSSWMAGQRDVTSRAAEDTHAAVERQAAARRSAQRTSVRLASASESEDVTTKVITNHNHTRALTVQYWEVHRLFDVTTAIQGATLVCLVPLQVIRFLPVGEALTLDSVGPVTQRRQVLHRYGQLLRHADLLARFLPRTHHHGLALLREFAADPRADVQDPSTSQAEDVVTVSVEGTFVPVDEIHVAAVTRHGTRIGPVRMTGTVPALPGGLTEPQEAFSHEGELFGYLRDQRNRPASAGTTLTARLALPPALARTDVVGFEVTRRIADLDYDFVAPELRAAARVSNLQPFDPARITIGNLTIDPAPDRHVRIRAPRLEHELGGPYVWNFTATIPGPAAGTESFVSDHIDAGARVQLPPGALPIAAVQLAPILRFHDLLRIERTLHHVVANALRYSRFVWSSLSNEERAILLEGFTIGVPDGGITDDTQDVPLLNCVTNEVLGFFGNSMILPFIIPQIVAQTHDVTNAAVEDALTAFHRVGFDPPRNRIALPTRGVLGEAVLGHCASAEKIDLTRFWNWADAPADNAPGISDVTLPTGQPSLTAGLTAPNALTGVAPLITNFNNAPPIPVDTKLLGSLITAGASQKDFTGLTNAAELAGLVKTTQTTAESARADALKRATELQSQAMTQIGNLFGAKGGEAYAANYRPAGATGATTPGSTSKTTAKPAADKPPPKPTPAPKPAPGPGGTPATPPPATPPTPTGEGPGPGGEPVPA
ncbi:hypothetical protein [Longispora fulva]|uniref:hypothetical protein n=1 Tax=Longispora fulva TaxID=619741 RepID=UPI0019404C89|nr:hypothetical protein [Longispora fulva]